MIVKAAPGLLVPMEGNPRQHITESEAVEVPDSTYYTRCLMDGDLVPAMLPKAKPAPKE